MEIPRSLSRFQVALGKAILEECASGVFGYSETQLMMKTAPEANHIDAAIKWQLRNRDGLARVARIAARAYEAKTDACLSILVDLAGDPEARKFLATVEPRYFKELFTEGTAQDGGALGDFLHLLQEIAQV